MRPINSKSLQNVPICTLRLLARALGHTAKAANHVSRVSPADRAWFKQAKNDAIRNRCVIVTEIASRTKE